MSTVCPVDILAPSLLTLTGLSICPSIRGGPQWPPSAARNFSSNCCRAVSCLLPSRALTRSGCSLPSASPAASSGGLVSVCPARCHPSRPYHTYRIHPSRAAFYPATSCHAKPDANVSSPPHLTSPGTIPLHHVPLCPATPCHTTPSHVLPWQAMSFSMPEFWDSRKLSFLDLRILKCLHPKVTRFWNADVSYGIPKYRVTGFGHSDKLKFSHFSLPKCWHSGFRESEHDEISGL